MVESQNSATWQHLRNSIPWETCSCVLIGTTCAHICVVSKGLEGRLNSFANWFLSLYSCLLFLWQTQLDKNLCPFHCPEMGQKVQWTQQLFILTFITISSVLVYVWKYIQVNTAFPFLTFHGAKLLKINVCPNPQVYIDVIKGLLIMRRVLPSDTLYTFAFELKAFLNVGCGICTHSFEIQS